MEPNRKYSKKREAIFSCICSTDTHPSAEWVYNQLKPQIPDLSLATVYRNLALFKREGRIVSVGVVQNLERFDANTAPHAHLVCSHCGAVVDVFQDFFTQPELDALSQQLCCAVQGARVTFEGLCPQCLAQQDAGKISEKPIQH